VSFRTVKPGNVFEIPDPAGDFYYAVVGQGLDCLFYDVTSKSPLELSALASTPHFLRVAVTVPSMKRAGWRRVGGVPFVGAVAEYGRYRNTPVGSADSFLYRNEDGSFTPASEEELAKFRTSTTRFSASSNRMDWYRGSL
jgi:hypothetical protein